MRLKSVRFLPENEWTCEACGDLAHGELEGSGCTDAAVHDECHLNLLGTVDGCPYCKRKSKRYEDI